MKTKDMIRSIDENMDDLISSCELVSSGIFRDKSALVSLRVRRKKRIPFFKFGNSYRFLKRDVIDFINANANPDDEYTGTFFLYKDEGSKKSKGNQQCREERLVQKVNFLSEEFACILDNKIEYKTEDGDEWNIALLNFSSRLITDCIKAIYSKKDYKLAFDNLVPRLRNLLEERG